MPSERTVTLCGQVLDRPGHVCAFFDSRDQQYEILLPYFQEGLDQDEQVINIVDAEQHDDHCARLHARGIAVDDEITRDRLRVLTSEETHMSGGRFAADRMYDLVKAALADADRKNLRVRFSGVMGSVTRGHVETEELMDYESRVNALVPRYDCTLVCVYYLDKIGGKMATEILRTHPYIVQGGHIVENPFYVPPIEVLKQVQFGRTSTQPTQESTVPLV